MVAPDVLAGWAMRASLRGNGIAFCDNDTGDAPFTGTIGLTTAHVNRRNARLGNVAVHGTLRRANVVSRLKAHINAWGEVRLHLGLACQMVPASEA
jgi:hypothetical protein